MALAPESETLSYIIGNMALHVAERKRAAATAVLEQAERRAIVSSAEDLSRMKWECAHLCQMLIKIRGYLSIHWNKVSTLASC